MRYKKKLILIFILVVVLTTIQYVLPANSKIVSFYDAFIFRPFQSVRNIVFSIVPISVGDFIYLAAGVGLAYVACKWAYYLLHLRTRKHELGASVLHTVIATAIVYIVFILGWGGNYYKPSLTSFWKLDKSHWDQQNTLAEFDHYLITRLNEYAPGYRTIPFRELDDQAKAFYRSETDSRTKTYGVKVKASMFGNLMQHFGIQGYYNPWTGEAQVNKYLPSFMLPFVICHEMAHQSGIAAEDDANLLSYAIGTIADDTTFKYSAYFNLWLYTHARLKRADSSLARKLALNLNPLTRSHLDTLKQLRKKYASDVSDYSGALYDGYLKLHHQKDGIESYNKVAITAWAWEQKRKGSVIEIP
jgi:hypothetical protein